MARARKERVEKMKALEIVKKIREQDKKGGFVMSEVAAAGLIFAFKGEEDKKEESGQGQLF